MADPKRLTVSYGAFTCTVEGFDEPFNIMKMVVDYFQSLTSSDPSFGSEPAQIDPMEVSKRAAGLPDIGNVDVALDATESDHITIRNREATAASVIAAATAPVEMPRTNDPIVYDAPVAMTEDVSAPQFNDAPAAPDEDFAAMIYDDIAAAAEIEETLAADKSDDADAGETPVVEAAAHVASNVSEDELPALDVPVVAEDVAAEAPAADTPLVETPETISTAEAVAELEVADIAPEHVEAPTVADTPLDAVAVEAAVESVTTALDLNQPVDAVAETVTEALGIKSSVDADLPEIAQPDLAASDLVASDEAATDVSVDWDDGDDDWVPDADVDFHETVVANAAPTLDASAPVTPEAGALVLDTPNLDMPELDMTDLDVPDLDVPVMETVQDAVAEKAPLVDRIADMAAPEAPEFDDSFDLDGVDEESYAAETQFTDLNWQGQRPTAVVEAEPLSLEDVVQAAKVASDERAENDRTILRPHAEANMDAFGKDFDESSISDNEEIEDDDHEDEEAWNAVFSALNASRTPLDSYVDPAPVRVDPVAETSAPAPTMSAPVDEEKLDPIEREEAALRRVLATLEAQGDTTLVPRFDAEVPTPASAPEAVAEAAPATSTLEAVVPPNDESDLAATSLPVFAPPKLEEGEAATTPPRRRITLRRRPTAPTSPTERPIQPLDEEASPIGKPWAAVDPIEGGEAKTAEDASSKFRLPFHTTIFGARSKPSSEVDVSSKLARGLMDDDEEETTGEPAVAARIEEMSNPTTPLKIVHGASAAELLEEGESELRDFARKFGAASLPDLLEASAAYETLVKGESLFSRQQILKALDDLGQNRDYTTEARIKSFGKLLRKGSIVRVEDGKFALSHSTRFNYEAKLGTG